MGPTRLLTGNPNYRVEGPHPPASGIRQLQGLQSRQALKSMDMQALVRTPLSTLGPDGRPFPLHSLAWVPSPHKNCSLSTQTLPGLHQGQCNCPKDSAQPTSSSPALTNPTQSHCKPGAGMGQTRLDRHLERATRTLAEWPHQQQEKSHQKTTLPTGKVSFPGLFQ